MLPELPRHTCATCVRGDGAGARTQRHSALTGPSSPGVGAARLL